MSQQQPTPPKINLSPEQIKQLMQMQELMKNGKQRPGGRSTKIMHAVLQNMMVLQGHLDRFINFITKGEDKDRNDVVQSARSPILFGTYVVLIFVVFGGLWTTFAPLNSATVAVGTLISSSQKKNIQNAEPGIIKKILVKQGDIVAEGDPVIELDDVRVRANYEANLQEYRALLAMESRLIAERDDLDQIEFSPILVKDISIPEVERAIHTQENLFKYRKENIRAMKESAGHKITQVLKSIEAYEANKVAIEKSYAVMQERVKGLNTLVSKGAATKTMLLEAESKEAELKSNLASNDAKIEQTKQELTNVEIEALNIDNKHLSEVLSQLRDVQVNRGIAQEKFNTASFSLDKIIVRSPVDGTVNIVNVHTIGTVVPAGHGLLEISPTNDSLVIEVNIPHRNIDAVKIGLVAKIRFSAFKSRTTSLFTGKLIALSADVVQIRNQQGQGDSFYVGKVEIDMDEFNRIAKGTKLELHPGMQAEVQIITGKRTLLRYLLDPLTDTMFRAFNEK
jgi:HlyD family secretion protein